MLLSAGSDQVFKVLARSLFEGEQGTLLEQCASLLEARGRIWSPSSLVALTITGSYLLHRITAWV